MQVKSKAATKRILMSALLGILFGFLCTYFASTENPAIWGTALMWSILFNRFLIGFVIGLAGFMKYHPCFGFRFYPALRGFCLGAIISLDSAIGVFIAPEVTLAGSTMSVTTIFWSTIVAGAIYGLIIDLSVTKFAGEGEDMINCTRK